MPAPSSPRPRLVLTRRGRLVRSIAVLAALLIVVLLVVIAVRALTGGAPEPAGSATPAAASPVQPESASASATTAAAEPTAELTAAAEEMARTGTVGDGTWTIAAPVAAPAPAGTVHTYLVRVEGGIGIDADAAAQEIAAVLADERGWRGVEDVTFQQVASPQEAAFTISIASPPTVDALCAPARTGGTWSCRIGKDVALNSDRWLHMTPTYDDLAAYRAYMVNHEVGHFLGHGHAACGGEGLAAPVMLQQSMDLGGCRPNAWPATDGAA